MRFHDGASQVGDAQNCFFSFEWAMHKIVLFQWASIFERQSMMGVLNAFSVLCFVRYLPEALGEAILEQDVSLEAIERLYHPRDKGFFQISRQY